MEKSPALSLKSFDAACIVGNLLTYRLFTRIPSFFPKTAGSAAALCTVFASLIAFALIWLITAVFCRLPRINIIDAAEAAFGVLGRKLVAIFVLFHLGISSIVILGEFAEFTKLISFPTAPLAFCAMFFVIAAIFGALSGLDAISRLHRLFVPLSVAILILVVVSTLWDGDYSNLFPVLGRGAENVFGKGISGIIMYTDIILLFLIAPSQKPHKETQKSILTAAGISLFVVSAVMFAFTVRIPYPVSAEGQFPIYLLLKEIHYGRFFQRIDAILLLSATLCGMLYLSLNLFFFTHIIKRDFGVSDAKPLIPTTALTVFFAAAGVKFIPAQLLSILLFCSGFAVIAVFLLTVIFVKVRRKFSDEKA